MTTLDEQMAAIERLARVHSIKLPLEQAYGNIYDADEEYVETSYLVACANAAPDLVEAIRWLRLADAVKKAEIERLRALLARQEPVVAAARESYAASVAFDAIYNDDPERAEKYSRKWRDERDALSNRCDRSQKAEVSAVREFEKGGEG